MTAGDRNRKYTYKDKSPQTLIHHIFNHELCGGKKKAFGLHMSSSVSLKMMQPRRKIPSSTETLGSVRLELSP